MAIPTKQEFEDLTNHCKNNHYGDSHCTKDYYESELANLVQNIVFPPPKIDISDVEGSAKSALVGFMQSRKKANKEMESFPAYKWMAVENEFYFKAAMKTLAFCGSTDNELIKVGTMVVFERHNKRDTKQELSILENLATLDLLDVMWIIKRKERLIGHISECFMHYQMPQKEFKPDEYKGKIIDAINNLERAHKSMEGLTKYNELFFGTAMFNSLAIQEQIDSMKLVYEKQVHPAKRSGPNHKRHMFIVNVTRWFFNQQRPSEEHVTYDISDVVNFIVELLQFYVFTDSMAKNNIKKAVEKECERLKAVSLINDEINKNKAINANRQKMIELALFKR